MKPRIYGQFQGAGSWQKQAHQGHCHGACRGFCEIPRYDVDDVSKSGYGMTTAGTAREPSLKTCLLVFHPTPQNPCPRPDILRQ